MRPLRMRKPAGITLGTVTLVWVLWLALTADGRAAHWPTEAGDRGRVIVVTTLADSGPGSLRAALAARGPRRIVFAVGGEIWLKDSLTISQAFVTVAGETAPAPGITLLGNRVRIRGHDVILRHLRIRPGALPGGFDAQNRDAAAIGGNEDGERPGYNIVMENCSVSWSVDELIQIWGRNSHDITVRRCIIAEALDRSIHPKGRHSMGLIIGPEVHNVLIAENLFAHNSARNPAISEGASAMIVNNLIYNPGFGAVHFYAHGRAGPTLATIVGNVVIGGQQTKRGLLAAFDKGIAAGSMVYYHDNIAIHAKTFNKNEKARQENSEFIPVVSSPPVWIGMIPPYPAKEVPEKVLAAAGARPWDRDATDRRIVAEVRSRGGAIRDWPADPRLDPNSQTRPRDSDEGGVARP